MIYILLFFIVYLLLNVYENFYREKWKYDKAKEQPKWSRKWHSIQWSRWALVFLVVTFSILGFNSNVMILFPLSAIWWIFFDGLLNVLRGRDFFYQSPYKNLSRLEQYASKTNKIILLIASIIVGIVVWKLL